MYLYAARHTPTQYALVGGCRADSIHTATSDPTKQFSLCRVWRAGVNWTNCSGSDQTSNIFVSDSLGLSGIQFTPLKRTRHRRDRFVVSGVAV